jgi:hypothetical protein
VLPHEWNAGKGHLKRQAAVDIRKKKIASPLRNKISVKNKTPD